MNSRTFKNIFGLMLTSVILMVGCGSSSNNPVSSGNISSGLVNVSGNVKNLTGNGSVSFYTPKAVINNSLNTASSFRTSIANDGVYTFNTDAKGNYSGQIPEGDYYVVAQNSDGTMKSVSGKQSFVAAMRANESGYTEVATITLKATTNITGTLTSSDIDVANIPVYIENTPFLAVTNSSGVFTFYSVPVIADNSSVYSLSASININGTNYITQSELTSSHFGGSSSLVSLGELAMELDSNSNQIISGHVYYENSTDPAINQNVTVILASGLICSSLTNEEGRFSFSVSPNDTVSVWAVNMQEKTVNTDNTLYISSTGSSSDSQNGIMIKASSFDTTYDSSYESNITLFKGNKEFLSERFYFLDTYTISNIDVGSYWYVIEAKKFNGNISSYTFIFSDNINVTANSYVTSTINSTVRLSKPIISVNELSEYSINIGSFDPTEQEQVSFSTYAINRDNPETKIELEYSPIVSTNARAATSSETKYVIDLSSLTASGTYDIYAEYEVKYNSKVVATVTSDPCPYVMH